MESKFTSLRELVLPAGAFSTSRIVLGPDVPAELATYYAASPYFSTVGAALLSYDSFGRYYYDAALGSVAAITYHAQGVVDSSGNVHEHLVYEVANLSYRRLILGGLAADVYGQSIVEIFPFTDFAIDSVSQGRGMLGPAVNIPDSGNLAAETVIATFTGTFRTGRTYEIDWNGLLRPAGGATGGLFMIRKTNALGAVYIGNKVTPTPGAADATATHKAWIRNTTGSDNSQTLALTLSPTGGVGTIRQLVSGATITGTLTVRDCAAATAFPNTISIA